MTHLAHPTTGSTNFEDVFAYWDAYWAPQSLLNGYCFPGIVDYEEGKIAGGNSKPAFPSKGIYPNKNMEKSKLFYGVRGVRQIAALFKMRVDGKYPRVILNHRRMYSTRIMAEAGIFYLATVDNFDKVEWYRTVNGGSTWSLLGNGVYDSGYSAYPEMYYLAEPYRVLGTNGELLYGSLPANVIISGGTMPRFAVKCRVYKGIAWAESDYVFADGTIEKNPNPKLTKPNITVGFVTNLGKRKVREPVTVISIEAETDVKFTRTEEEEAFSVRIEHSTSYETQTCTIETLARSYGVGEPKLVVSVDVGEIAVIRRQEVLA